MRGISFLRKAEHLHVSFWILPELFNISIVSLGSLRCLRAGWHHISEQSV